MGDRQEVRAGHRRAEAARQPGERRADRGAHPLLLRRRGPDRAQRCRGQHRDVLVPEINRELKARKRADLLAKLHQAGIPCGEVLGLHEALTSPRATSAGLVSTHPHAEAGSVQVLAPPYRFDGERLPVRKAPPSLGEGTGDVLQSLLGMEEAQIAALRERGVL